MITGKENILQWFEASGQNSFVIYLYGKSDSSQIVASSTEGIDAKRALQELSQQLDWHRGRFSMAACNDGKRSPRSDWRTDIEISGTAAVMPYPPQPATVNGLSQDEVDKAVVAGIERYKSEQELKELRAKVAQLEKENKELQKTDPWDRIGEIAMQFLPGFLGKQQAQVAGFPPHTNFQHNHQATEQMANETIDQATQERFENVIATFQRVAPNEWLELLEKLAAKVEQNPGIIAQFKMFL